MATAVGAADYFPKALVELQPRRGGALIVDKSQATLDFFDIVEGKLAQVKHYDIASGKQRGDKVFRGDRRTPEGIYFFTEFKDKTRLAPKYGDGAFVMDYPNRFDEFLKKTGGGIWLHGTNEENRISVKYDSEGCVVVRNSVFNELAPLIHIQDTPIIVYNEVPLVSDEERGRTRKELSEFLEKWRQSWEGKQIEDYMGAYSLDKFLSRGMTWSGWKAYKNNLNKVYDKIQVTVQDPRIFYFHPYAFITFTQEYHSPNVNDSGNKRLGLYYDQGAWKIVTEYFYKTGSSESARNVSGMGTSTPQ